MPGLITSIDFCVACMQPQKRQEQQDPTKHQEAPYLWNSQHADHVTHAVQDCFLFERIYWSYPARALSCLSHSFLNKA
jgi:hypothetical protein